VSTPFNTTFEKPAGVANLTIQQRPDPRLVPPDSVVHRNLFHGRPLDGETGLYYFRNRYYDPELGRFTSVDPLGYVDGPSMYGFAMNGPMNGGDPLGLVCLECRNNPGTKAKRKLGIQLQQRREDFETIQGAYALLDQVSGADGVGVDDVQLALFEYLRYRPRVSYEQGWSMVAMLTGRGSGGVNKSFDDLAGIGHWNEVFANYLEMYSMLPLGLDAAWLGKLGVDAVRRQGFKTAAREMLREFRPGAWDEAVLPGKTVKLLPAGSTVANAGGEIASFVTQKQRTFYRVFSGESTRGAFLTSVKPTSSAFAREALALPPGNTASFVQEVLVPAGTRLQRSRALPAFGRRGGAEQFQLLEEIPNFSFGPGVRLP
jgi:RHS repeat-associated protein